MPGYYLDPDGISLDYFFDLLMKRRMIPSRRMLQGHAGEIRTVLHKMGLKTLGAIIRQLSSNSSFQRFSHESGLPEELIKLLRREARSWQVKRAPLDSLAGFPYEYTEMLKSKGIRNTADLWNRTLEGHKRMELSANMGIPDERMKEMHERCDLLRIRGVGPQYARIIHHAGITSVRSFAITKAHAQQSLYLEAMKELRTKPIPLSVEDIQYCIDYARIILEFAADEEIQ